LQVWDSKGRLVFEKKHQSEVVQWAICFNNFIYKTEDPDPNSEYFTIVDLSKSKCVTLVTDFIEDESFKYFAFSNNKLYAANDEVIKVAAVKQNLLPDHEAKRYIRAESVAEIKPCNPETKAPHRIHGLAMTDDSIITKDNPDDLIHVFIEIDGENLVSAN